MEVFKEFLSGIDNLEHRERTEEILSWVSKTFPQLQPVVKWNQPMFTDHDTYIIGFSVAKKHLAVAPENAGIVHVTDDIEKAGYSYTKELIRFPWDRPVEFSLLEKMIDFNILDKANCTTFWRK